MDECTSILFVEQYGRIYAELVVIEIAYISQVNEIITLEDHDHLDIFKIGIIFYIILPSTV